MSAPPNGDTTDSGVLGSVHDSFVGASAMKLIILDEGGIQGVLYFTVEGPVGFNGRNLIEDVFLVQFFLRKLGRPGTLTGANNVQPRMAKVPLSGYCDNPTIDGI